MKQVRNICKNVQYETLGKKRKEKKKLGTVRCRFFFLTYCQTKKLQVFNKSEKLK